MKDGSELARYDRAYFDNLLQHIDARIEAKKVVQDRDRRKIQEPFIGEDRRQGDRRGKPREVL